MATEYATYHERIVQDSAVGEHTSLCHAWSQGAIESGPRAASEIHYAASGS